MLAMHTHTGPDVSEKSRLAPGQDEAFAYGVCALARTLLRIQREQGACTVYGLISRLAPPPQDDTAAYVQRVAQEMAVGPFERLRVEDHLAELVEAIHLYEHGEQPLCRAAIERGVELALQ